MSIDHELDTVLLIEPNDELRALLLEHLTTPDPGEQPFAVIQAHTTEEADKILELSERKPNAVVLDLDPHLDKKDPVLFLRDIQKQHPNNQIPIVAISERDDTFRISAAQDAGAKEILPKPIEPTALRRAIRMQIAQNHV